MATDPGPVATGNSYVATDPRPVTTGDSSVPSNTGPVPPALALVPLGDPIVTSSSALLAYRAGMVLLSRRLVLHVGPAVLLACASVPPPPRSSPPRPDSDPTPPGSHGASASEAGTVPPFDRGAAARALASVDVSSCATAGGPTGPGHVTVVFAIDGGVSSVRIDRAPYEDTIVGRCIAEQFRGLRVPAFEGPAVTVGKGFRVE
jgi:hypothetical protein